MSEPRKLVVFLSHASQDKPAVRRLCKRLKADGFDPWLDEERLLPGQDWSLEIERAMRTSDAIVLCFSSLSVDKEGYIQREYKRAISYQEEKPEGTVFVIPIRLDDCDMPHFMRGLQWVDYPAGYDRLVKALNLRAGNVPDIKPPKKKEEKKISTKKKLTSRPTYNIKGGIHATTVIIGDQEINNAKRDIIKGNQTKTTVFTINQPPQDRDEFIILLNDLQAQLTTLQQQAGLSGAQKQILASSEQKLAEAAEEVKKPKPLGKRIKTTLTEAKDYIETIGGSLTSAVTLGTTIGTLLAGVAKLFGL